MVKTLRLTNPQNSYRLEELGVLIKEAVKNEIHFLMAALSL